MSNSNLLKLAAVLGAICGLMELYEALTFVEDIKRGSTNVARGVFIFIFPLVIVAGAFGIYLEKIILGAGVIVIGIGMQHYLVDMGSRHLIAVIFGFAAVAVAMYVQRKYDFEELKNVEEEHVTVLPTS